MIYIFIYIKNCTCCIVPIYLYTQFNYLKKIYYIRLQCFLGKFCIYETAENSWATVSHPDNHVIVKSKDSAVSGSWVPAGRICQTLSCPNFRHEWSLMIQWQAELSANQGRKSKTEMEWESNVIQFNKRKNGFGSDEIRSLFLLNR